MSCSMSGLVGSCARLTGTLPQAHLLPAAAVSVPEQLSDNQHTATSGWPCMPCASWLNDSLTGLAAWPLGSTAPVHLCHAAACARPSVTPSLLEDARNCSTAALTQRRLSRSTSCRAAAPQGAGVRRPLCRQAHPGLLGLCTCQVARASAARPRAACRSPRASMQPCSVSTGCKGCSWASQGCSSSSRSSATEPVLASRCTAKPSTPSRACKPGSWRTWRARLSSRCWTAREWAQCMQQRWQAASCWTQLATNQAAWEGCVSTSRSVAPASVEDALPCKNVKPQRQQAYWPLQH